MEVFDLGLVKLGLFDVIDIVLVAFIIYQIYNLIRGTIAVNIFMDWRKSTQHAITFWNFR